MVLGKRPDQSPRQYGICAGLAQQALNWAYGHDIWRGALKPGVLEEFLAAGDRMQRVGIAVDPMLFFCLPQSVVTADHALTAMTNVSKYRREVDKAATKARYGKWVDFCFYVASWAPREVHTKEMIWMAIAGDATIQQLRDCPKMPFRKGVDSKRLQHLLEEHPLVDEDFALELVQVTPWAVLALPVAALTSRVLQEANRVAESLQMNLEVVGLLAATRRLKLTMEG